MNQVLQPLSKQRVIIHNDDPFCLRRVTLRVLICGSHGTHGLGRLDLLQHYRGRGSSVLTSLTHSPLPLAPDAAKLDLPPLVHLVSLPSVRQADRRLPVCPAAVPATASSRRGACLPCAEYPFPGGHPSIGR